VIVPNSQVFFNVSRYLRKINSRAIEQLIIHGIGWLPSPLGILLRRQIYSIIFACMGKATYFQTGIEVLGASAIELGNEVKILRDVRLNFKSPGSRLRLGNKVCLDRGVDINAAGDNCLVEIGDFTYLGPYVCMAGPGHVKIGKKCLIASQTGIYANNHREYGLSREGIEIQDNCWLGCGVRVLDGVIIGEGSVIGAGAVVSKDIPPFSIAVGVPAKVIKASKGGVA
jgi:acetyltransferase-like isoleucine patch superfamily enzyme